MQVWFATVVILFALSQFWDWVQSIEYSPPLVFAGGLLLALISNYDRRSSIPFWPTPAQAETGVQANYLQRQTPVTIYRESRPVGELEDKQVTAATPDLIQRPQ